jgi:hypothetical protein
MRTHDMEATYSLPTLGHWRWKMKVTSFFIHQFMGHYKLFIRGKFFWQIPKDGATNQTLQYDISHMCVTCKPHSCP